MSAYCRYYEVRHRKYDANGKVVHGVSCHNTKDAAYKAAKRRQYAVVIAPDGRKAMCEGGRCDGLAGLRRKRKKTRR